MGFLGGMVQLGELSGRHTILPGNFGFTRVDYASDLPRPRLYYVQKGEFRVEIPRALQGIYQPRVLQHYSKHPNCGFCCSFRVIPIHDRCFFAICQLSPSRSECDRNTIVQFKQVGANVCCRLWGFIVFDPFNGKIRVSTNEMDWDGKPFFLSQMAGYIRAYFIFNGILTLLFIFRIIQLAKVSPAK